MKSSASDREPERKLALVLGFIQEHYTETLTIEELAEVCHFSQAHFMSFFKRVCGDDLCGVYQSLQAVTGWQLRWHSQISR